MSCPVVQACLAQALIGMQDVRHRETAFGAAKVCMACRLLQMLTCNTHRTVAQQALLLDWYNRVCDGDQKRACRSDVLTMAKASNRLSKGLWLFDLIVHIAGLPCSLQLVVLPVSIGPEVRHRMRVSLCICTQLLHQLQQRLQLAVHFVLGSNTCL